MDTQIQKYVPVSNSEVTPCLPLPHTSLGEVSVVSPEIVEVYCSDGIITPVIVSKEPTYVFSQPIPETGFEAASQTSDDFLDKRVQMLRTKTVLDKYHQEKSSMPASKLTQNWGVILAVTAAIALLVLMLGPLFGNVSTALASL